MPNYTVIITNRADPLNQDKAIGSFYVETVDAPNTDIVEAIIVRDLNRVVNSELYSWTIQLTAP